MTCSTSTLMVGMSSEPNALVVTDDELRNIDFVNDVLNYAQECCLKPAEWRSYLTQAYANYEGRIINSDGIEQFLDMDLFEVDEEILFASNDVSYAARHVTIANNAIRDWFDYWLCNPVERSNLNVSSRTKERIRVVATILRAVNPVDAQFWGLKGKAANDN